MSGDVKEESKETLRVRGRGFRRGQHPFWHTTLLAKSSVLYFYPRAGRKIQQRVPRRSAGCCSYIAERKGRFRDGSGQLYRSFSDHKGYVLFESDVELRNDIVDLLSARRQNRSARRNRKTRYRRQRFSNRERKDGWLAPSVQNKVDTHLTAIRKIHEILPVSKIIVEVASFDIQKIKNPANSGSDYQKGEQMGFWNVREYVLFRDGHECQCCHGRSKDRILNVHHMESRKTNNLITLCETCHTGYHKGGVNLPKTIRRGRSEMPHLWALCDGRFTIS